MWVASIFITLGLCYGVLGFNELCHFEAHKACQSENLPDEIPEIKEEIIDSCKEFKIIDGCINNGLKTCHLEDQEMELNDQVWLELRQKILGQFKEICSLKPDLYSKFLRSRNCTTNATNVEFIKKVCGKSERKLFTALQKRKERLVKDENMTMYNGCLSELFQKNCVIYLYNWKCGSDASEAMFQIFEKTTDWDDVCPLEIRIDVLELLDDLRSLTEVGLFVRVYLRTDALF